MKAHWKELSIEKMAQVLQVSRSRFYSPRKDQNYATLDEQIKEVFKEKKGRYGSARVYAALKRQDIPCSRYKVEQRMRILGLYAGKKKRKPKTTIGLKGGSNLLARDFTATESVRNLLMKRGICASQGFSAYGNAAMESFFGSLKAELMPSGMRFESQEEAKLKLFEYIEIYYNKKRLH